MLRVSSPLECLACPAKASCFVHEAGIAGDPVRFAEFRKRRRGRELSKGDTIYDGHRPAGVWIVCRGRVKICKDAADGKPLILRLAQPGDLIGYAAYLSTEASSTHAMAMEPVKVAFLERSYLEELLATHTRIVLPLLRQLAKDLGEAETIATNMAYQGARERIRDALLKLASEHTRAERNSLDAVSLRRQDLAALAGVSVETTVRILKEMEREGLLNIRGREIRLRSRSAFEQFESLHIVHGAA